MLGQGKRDPAGFLGESSSKIRAGLQSFNTCSVVCLELAEDWCGCEQTNYEQIWDDCEGADLWEWMGSCFLLSPLKAAKITPGLSVPASQGSRGNVEVWKCDRNRGKLKFRRGMRTVLGFYLSQA